MSDFLSRLAARAIGAKPSARPRLPSLFEAAPGSGTGLDVVEEEVSVRAAPGSGLGSAAGSAPAGAERMQTSPGIPSVAPDFGPTESPARAPAPAPVGRPATPGEPHVDGEAREQPRADEGRPHAEGPTTSVDSPSGAHTVPAVAQRAPARSTAPLHASRSQRGSAPAVNAVPHIVAAPMRPNPPAFQAAARVDLRSPQAEPAVRVHIGRLEVRAIVPDPPRRQPNRERLDREGLSLADYLRGRRDAP